MTAQSTPSTTASGAHTCKVFDHPRRTLNDGEICTLETLRHKVYTTFITSPDRLTGAFKLVTADSAAAGDPETSAIARLHDRYVTNCEGCLVGHRSVRPRCR